MRYVNFRPRSCLLGCGCALAILALVAGLGAIIAGPTLGAMINVIMQGGPYQIAHRPLPSDGQQDTLLPATVGSFTRGEVTVNGNLFTTTYSDGTNTIQAIAAAFDSSSAAQGEVQGYKSRGTGTTFSVVGFDPSYVSDTVTQGKETWLAYSRGQYFFYFNANSSSALDSFMTKFSY